MLAIILNCMRYYVYEYEIWMWSCSLNILFKTRRLMLKKIRKGEGKNRGQNNDISNCEDVRSHEPSSRDSF